MPAGQPPPGLLVARNHKGMLRQILDGAGHSRFTLSTVPETPARFETEQLEEYAAKEPLGLHFKRASDAAPAAGSQDAQEPQGAAVSTSGACWHQVYMKGENSKLITKTGIH